MCTKFPQILSGLSVLCQVWQICFALVHPVNYQSSISKRLTPCFVTIVVVLVPLRSREYIMEGLKFSLATLSALFILTQLNLGDF